MTTITRCLNIDWLEVYCLEPISSPRDADYYRSLGLSVYERPYGTRVYRQMFTIYEPTTEQPWIEVRRDPVDATSQGFKVNQINSCHLRLHNRTCYAKGAAKIMAIFMQTHGYTFSRISRIDLALDFERFDSGDYPNAFLQRYMRGVYAKINQANISAHGTDHWNERKWNSCSWGSRTSAVSTKFYNKTQELQDERDKPYIRQAWAVSGLVDDFIQLTKKGEDGVFYKPEIWRLEFSINSKVKNWMQLETCMGEENKYVSIKNTLDCYYSDESMLSIFFSLVDKYFHFKHCGPGKSKYDCEDKYLFDTEAKSAFFKVERPAAHKTDDKTLLALLMRLERFRASHFENNLCNAADVLINYINEQHIKLQAAMPWDADEVEILRRLLAKRINEGCNQPLSIDRKEVESLYALERTLWSEEPEIIKSGTVVPRPDFPKNPSR